MHGGSLWGYLFEGVGCGSPQHQKAAYDYGPGGEQIPLGLGAFEPNVVPFSQSLSTLALIEEFLGKREMPCLPGAEGQGVQKWVRNVSYFREFFAALFLEPWHGLLKVFFSFSFSLLLHSPSNAQEQL